MTNWRMGELYFIAPARITRPPKAWERVLIPVARRLQYWLEYRSDQLRHWSYELSYWREGFKR